MPLFEELSEVSQDRSGFNAITESSALKQDLKKVLNAYFDTEIKIENIGRDIDLGVKMPGKMASHDELEEWWAKQDYNLPDEGTSGFGTYQPGIKTEITFSDFQNILSNVKSQAEEKAKKKASQASQSESVEIANKLYAPVMIVIAGAGLLAGYIGVTR